MKKFSVLTTIVITIILAAWTCSTAMAATATGSFTYDFTIDPPCSDTVTKNCIDHFQIFDVTAHPADVSLSSIVPPANSSTTTGVSTVPFNFKVGAPYGSRKWAVTAVAKDNTGAFVSTDPTLPQAQATVIVKPGSPASFVVTLQ